MPVNHAMTRSRSWIGWIRRLALGGLVLVALVMTLPQPTSAQLPGLFQTSPTGTNSLMVPLGVQRYGDLEVAKVYSPATEQPLFEIAAPTVLDRMAPPSNSLPVELRVADIEGRLRLASERLIEGQWAAQGQGQDHHPLPQLETVILNQVPVVRIREADSSRALRLVTVTEQDSLYHGQDAEALAMEWQQLLEAEVVRLQRLFSGPYLVRSGLQSGLIGLAMVGITGVLWVLRRLLRRHQTYLRQRQQAVGKARADLIADTAATSLEQVSDPAGGGPVVQPASHQSAILASLQQRFSLQRRIRFYTLMKWLLFWLGVLVWYGGILWIAYTFPYFMRFRDWIGRTPLELLLIWFGVGLGIRVSHGVIDANIIKRFSSALPMELTANPAEEQRRELQAATITGALEGLATVIFIILGIIWTLNAFNLSANSILAGGAILGLAISFGSQSLVKDLVNGSLILLEDQFAVGDVVELDSDAGVVENVNLRITQIRNTQGELITIPNSVISRVKNMTRLWSRVDFMVEVDYNNDIDAVLALMRDVAEAMYRDPQWQDYIIAPPDVLGVDHISHAGMQVRVWLQTAPMQQWAVGREYRRRIRQAFAQHHVAIGRPQWVTHTVAAFPDDGLAGDEATETDGHRPGS